MNENMRLECSRLHERHAQRLKALEDYQKIQNGSLVRMADSMDNLRGDVGKSIENLSSRLTWMIIAMVVFMALAIPEVLSEFGNIFLK